MPPSEYERFRKHLEQQLRADVELLYEGYRAKLRAYEMVARLRGDLGGEAWPPLDLARSLPPGPPAPPAPVPAQLSAEAGAQAPAPPPRRGKAYELFDAIFDLLATLPEVFDKGDLVRALGHEPRRTTLHDTLELLIQDGLLEVAQHGSGKRPTRYRKTAAAAASS